jgi:roadblock/LC7 domain-containing protein
MIHDFWTDNRYEAVLKYMDCIDRAGTLGVFVKKPELDFSTFEQDLALYARNPR